MKSTYLLAAGVLATVGSIGTALPTSAATGGCPGNQITTYIPEPGVDGAFGVTAGPGGTWYAHGGTINRINNGRVDQFPIPDGDTASAGWMAWDGTSSYVWFTDRGNGRLGTVDGHGTVHEYQVPSGGPINSIVLGPGSDVWFTDPANDRIGVLNSATGNVTEWATPTAGGWPLGLTRGPDGLLYFTERSAAKIARWNADGSFTEWDLAPDAFPNRIVVGPDHALWFTELLSGMIGRLDTAGNLTETPIDGGPVGITTGPDGQLYVALFFDGAVARLDGTGAVTERWALPHGALIVGASRDSVWATNGFDDSVARLRTSC